MKLLPCSYLADSINYHVEKEAQGSCDLGDISLKQFKKVKGKRKNKPIIRYFLINPPLYHHGHQFDGLCQGWGFKTMDALRSAIKGHKSYFTSNK
jgi:hypothetical protein